MTRAALSAGRFTPSARPTASVSCRGRIEQRQEIGVGAPFAERHAGQGVEPAQRHQEQEFLPDRDPHIGAQDAVEASRGAELAQLLAAPARPAVELAKGHFLIGAGLAHDTGGDDRAGDKGGAAHDRLGPEDCGEPVGRIDAVLQGDDRGLRPDQRAELRPGALDIPKLDAKEHVIDRADRRDVVGRPGRADLGFAAVAFDPQAMLAHRREMRAARDKGDLRPRLGERGAVGAADPAGADNRDPHSSTHVTSAATGLF